MMHYVIVERHNNEIVTVRGPYSAINHATAYTLALDHLDKCKAYRAKHPLPLKVTFTVHSVASPDYVS